MRSPFASDTITDPIPLPFDEGQWIKVRALTGAEYEAAQVAHRADFVNGDKWAGVFVQSIAEGPDSDAVQKALRDPLTGFDRYALARHGVVEWSYKKSLQPVTVKSTVEGEPDRVYDAIKDLTDDAVEFMARAVLKETKPSLFAATVEDAENAKVKD